MNRAVFLITIAAAILVPLSPSALASSPEAFTQGNAAYEADDFQRAYDLYQSIIDSGDISPDLFYNLGNTAFRLDRDGEAALWYRRALALEPRHVGALQNMRVIENKTGFLQTETTSTQRFLDRFSHSLLLILLAVAFWSLVLSMLTLFIARPSRFGGYHFVIITARVVSLILLAFCIVALVLRSQRRPIEKNAVVLAEEAVARTSPYADAKDIIALPPGSQVTRLTDRGPWTYVGVGDDIRGWVRADEIEALWPFDRSFVE